MEFDPRDINYVEVGSEQVRWLRASCFLPPPLAHSSRLRAPNGGDQATIPNRVQVSSTAIRRPRQRRQTCVVPVQRGSS